MKAFFDTPQSIYARETAAWRKAHNICTKRGHETAAKGRTMCITCLEKKREYNNSHSKTFSTEQRYAKYIHNSRRYDLLVAFGVCTNCGKRNAASGHRYCNECLIKHRRKAETARRKAGIYPHDGYSNMCFQCGKNPPVDGKKLCSTCYEKTLRNLAKAHIANNQNRDKHIWRAMNNIIFNKNKADGGTANEV